jgi:hypothetical protein
MAQSSVIMNINRIHIIIGEYFIMRGFLLFLLLILSFILLPSCQSSKEETADQPPWSVRMYESVMIRNPEPWMIDFRMTKAARMGYVDSM